MHGFAYIMKIVKQHPDENFKVAMIDRLEKRWNQLEQPLFLISFLLHPQHRLKKFKSNNVNLDLTTLGQWMTYYYLAFFKRNPLNILLELTDWIEENYPFDGETFSNFNGDVIKYWKFVNQGSKELSSLALHIFAICINSASAERLFSSMGFFHNKRRNRLNVSLSLNYFYINISLSQQY
jgi:hypothetical protein